MSRRNSLSVHIFSFVLLSLLSSVCCANTKLFCQPNTPCWPSVKDWLILKASLHGHLVVPRETLAICRLHPVSASCQKAKELSTNPFYLENNPGDTQSIGWLNAWQSEPSQYAVLAQNEKDVQKAVQFATKHNIQMAIKGAGHDYLGRNSAKNSLLIWLRPIEKLDFNPNFLPKNAPKSVKPVVAITVGAGERWLNVYDVVTTKNHRYVQGGGCASVGATGGFTQGGGFGSWSKNFGTGAAGVLEFNIVTADGKLITANAYQNSDLFWAVKGGGGGTFGVITEMTLLTHELPDNFALVRGEIKASSNDDYRKLVKDFLIFFRDNLNNAHWEENLSFSDGKVSWFLLSQGLDKSTIESTWNKLKKLYPNMKSHIEMIEPRNMWNFNYMKKNFPDLVVENTAPDAKKGEFWWAPNSGEVSTFWYTYQSWWLPEDLFKSDMLSKTADVFWETSLVHDFSFHIQKGLSGGSQTALDLTRATSTHPGVFKATGLVIMSAGTNKLDKINKAIGEQKAKIITHLMAKFKSLAPNAGTYANEANYFEDNWQQAFWGENYSKLSEIKQKYDKNHVFYCHHCVA